MLSLDGDKPDLNNLIVRLKLVKSDEDMEISATIGVPKENMKDIWATKEQAEASLAMSQLSQLMNEVNKD